MNTFIEKYENALSDDYCDYIVNLIESNPALTYAGRTGATAATTNAMDRSGSPPRRTYTGNGSPLRSSNK